MRLTIASLQRFTTLGGVALAAGWAWHFASRGRWVLAACGALGIVFGYALVLGVEMLAMRLVSRTDPTPAPSPRQLLAAWWGEVCTAPRVFCWQQPFRTNAEPDHAPPHAAGRVGVVLVHGFVCNRAMWNPWMKQLRQAGVPFVAVTLEPAFGSIDQYAPIINGAVRRLQAATGHPVVVVAHSMGGVAVRAWMASDPMADERVSHVITIATPHGGTWLARFAVTSNSSQMRLNGAWIRSLAQREPEARRARFTCFYTHCDNIVFPPAVATLPGAGNRLVQGVAHVQLAFQDEVLNEVLRRTGMSRGAGHSAP